MRAIGRRLPSGAYRKRLIFQAGCSETQWSEKWVEFGRNYLVARILADVRFSR
jgi:hypothetical protein